MAFSMIGKIIKPPRMSVKVLPRFSSLWTPDYLETMKPKIPQYPVINVRISGYDFPVLEHFQRLICKLAENLDIDIESSYGLPAKVEKIQRYKPRSVSIDVEYKLHLYERNIQLGHLSSLRLPILLQLIDATMPEGVILNVEEWNPAKEELRYIPDKQLLDLKDELEGMQHK